jgi:hypothetical protein
MIPNEKAGLTVVIGSAWILVSGIAAIFTKSGYVQFAIFIFFFWQWIQAMR